MNCVVLFVAFCVALASAAGDDCKKLDHPKTMHCCKKKPDFDMKKMEDLKECFALRAKPPSCEVEICAAKKRGFAGEKDGEFDKKLAEESIKKEMDSTPELVELIIKNCVNGDLSDFGPPDACDLMKLKHCMHMHSLVLCPEWSNEGDCSGVKELVETCIKA